MIEKSAFSQIEKFTIFSEFPKDVLLSLLKSSTKVSFAKDDIIFKRGDSSNDFYIILSGKVKIIQIADKESEVSLAVIRGKGDFIGEKSLNTGMPRTGSAKAFTDTTLLAIPGDELYNSILNTPDLRNLFDKTLHFASIERFLKNSYGFSILPEDEIYKLTRHIKSEFHKRGKVIFRQGTQADNLYIIEHGKIKVVRWSENKHTTIGFLQEGDIFGETAIIENTTRNADMVCLSDCSLFAVPSNLFSDLLYRFEKLKKTICDKIESRKKIASQDNYARLIQYELEAFKGADVENNHFSKNTNSQSQEIVRKNFTSFYRKYLTFPFIKQDNPRDSGPICLKIIGTYYGKKIPLNVLRNMTKIDEHGPSIPYLAATAEQIGFYTRRLKMDYESLISMNLPCIIPWKNMQFAVVYKGDNKNMWVSDPEIGRCKFNRTDFLKNWNGITLLLQPTESLKKQISERSSFTSFYDYFTPHKQVIFEIFLASLIINIFGLAIPLFTQNIIDKVLVHHNVSMLNIMLVGMIIILFFRFLTTISRQNLVIHTSIKIDLHMLVLFYKHLFSLPISYFKERKIGEFITRFGENQKIRRFMTNTALTLILDFILIIVYLGLMAYYNVEMTLAVMLFLPAYLAITIFFSPILKKLNHSLITSKAEAESLLIESIEGIETVKASNIEHQTRAKWEDKFVNTLNIDFKLYNSSMYFQFIGDFLSTLNYTIVLWYGAHKVIQAKISMGELMAFMALMHIVIAHINRVLSTWDGLQETIVAVERLNDVFNTASERGSNNANAGLMLKSASGAIDFENVCFRYNNSENKQILSNINIKINPGEKIAFVGRSGSGKSTIVRLLAKFYEATEGRILFDGHNIKNINPSNLRSLIGFVFQDSFIFNGSIRENISVHDANESMEKIIEAAKLAGAHNFISDLKNAYETQIGSGGIHLSGGQRQRVAISRALYNNPKILILDEPTSSLDAESEQIIRKNLKSFLDGKTAIIIAHKLNTIKDVDRIYMIDDGNIVESGNHEELIREQGLYYNFYNQQIIH